MLLRILGMASGAVAFAASFGCCLAGGVLALSSAKLLNGPAGALLLGASLVASVVAFRAVHDWVVLRWSNEAKPFLYGAWRFRRFV